MEKVNVLNTNGEKTNHIINTLLDSALEFFGEKYEDIIIQAIREVDFYELSRKENMDRAISTITGHLVKDGTYKYNSGCFIYPINPYSTGSCGYNDTIVYRSYMGVQSYQTLAHELFGHTVCSRENRIIKKNNKLYNRNGIALQGIDNQECLNRYLNEGAMDFISESILRNCGIKARTSTYYEVAKMSCERISDYIGKDKFIETLVDYNNDIKEEIDYLVEDGYFDELSYLNDKRYDYESRAEYLKSYVYKRKIKQELKKMS